MPMLETMAMQTTLKRQATLEGIGVHSGRPARIALGPADRDAGVVFVRGGARPVPALWREASRTKLGTRIGRGSGSIATVEHVMAALHGLGVDNALVEIDGPEAPAMDGSAAPFVAAIDEAGLATLDAPRRYIRIVEPVRVARGGAWAELRPAPAGLRLEVDISFPASPIGRQAHALALAPESFRREIARARSFGFVHDAERLWKAGFALGASLENTVAIADGRVLNPEGLRFRDEFARHKMLDAIGDLALAGAPIIGAFHSSRGGHRLNLALLAHLFATPSAYAVLGDRRARRGSLGHSRAHLALPGA